MLFRSDADIGMSGGNLYNPGKTGCYWLVVDVYGEASADDDQHGPLALAEFYHFDKVDNWFSGNPDFVTVNENQSGTTKTSLQLFEDCIAYNHCKDNVRDKLIACIAKAAEKQDKDGAQDCYAAADKICTSEGHVAPSAGRKKSSKKSDQKNDGGKKKKKK